MILLNEYLAVWGVFFEYLLLYLDLTLHGKGANIFLNRYWSSNMNNYQIPNLAKAVEILKLLAIAQEGLTASEIEERLDIPRTTAFRILKTLQASEMVEKKGMRFYPGAKLLEIGLKAVSKYKLREISVPVLQHLASATRQTAHLAVLSGHKALILEVCDSAEPVLVASRPGTLAELHCSSNGKIFLAYNEFENLEEYMKDIPLDRKTPHTISTIEELRKELVKVRREGYAMDDQEYHIGVRCIAAPITNINGDVVAGIGITGPITTPTNDKLQGVAGYVKQAAKKRSGTVMG